jgi:ribosome biogenesis protein BRX1
LQLDSKDEIRVVTEIAEVDGCNGCVFFEGRKHRDLYVWFARTPTGPSVKFHIANVHTMDELRLTGNCLRGSRPLLSFDASFDSEPHWQLMKEMLIQIFGTPRGHPKSQPFHDHVYNFTVCDGRVWFRNYQILDHAKEAKARARILEKGETPTELVEIGPRFVMNPVKIFAGAMSGHVIWSNPTYVSPNRLRHQVRYEQSEDYMNRLTDKAKRAARDKALEAARPTDELADVFK